MLKFQRDNEYDESTSNDQRLKKLEWKLSLLVTISIIQAALLGVIAISSVVNSLRPSYFTMIFLLIVAGVGFYFFRRQIPGWIGDFSRYIFAQLRQAEKSDSSKDQWNK